MNNTSNNKCNYTYFFLLALLAITSFGFGKYYSEARTLREGGVALNSGNTGSGVNPNDPTAQQPQAPAEPEIDPTKIPPVNQTDRVRGNPDAPIVLIEYSDLDCPFCQRFHQTVKAILEKYPNDVKWVYRHFPLTSIHPEALAKAQATECIAVQGGDNAYWALIDEYFGSSTGTVDTKTAVEKLGYDFAAVDTCVKDERYKQFVESQLNDGIAANINGTPGSVLINTINNKSEVLPGAVDEAFISAAIDRLLEN